MQDLLAPVAVPIPLGVREAILIEQLKLRYLNPFSGVYVSTAHISSSKPSTFRLRGKNMLSLLFLLNGDVVYVDSEQHEWGIPANHLAIMYRPSDQHLKFESVGHSKVLSVGIHFTLEAAVQEPFRSVLEGLCDLRGSSSETVQARLIAALPINDSLRGLALSMAARCDAADGISSMRDAITVLEVLDGLKEYDPSCVRQTNAVWPSRGDVGHLFEAKRIIEEQYFRPIQIGALAQDLSMSPSKLKSGFRQLFGIPPMAHLSTVRIDQAKKLLSRSDASISQVAWAVGYSHPCNFAVAFRRHTGVTPKDYRKAHAIGLD